MDKDEEIRWLRVHLDELSEQIRTLSEKQDGQYTDVILHLKRN